MVAAGGSIHMSVTLGRSQGGLWMLFGTAFILPRLIGTQGSVAARRLYCDIFLALMCSLALSGILHYD